MAFCSQCGAKIEDGSKFCPGCGAPVENSGATGTPSPGAQSTEGNTKEGFGGAYGKYFAYTDTTSSYTEADRTQNNIVAILSYLHILVLVPLIAKKESPFTQYHAKLGLNLLLWHIVAEVGGSIILNVLGWIPVVGWLLGIAIWLVNAALWGVAVFGLVNAAQGKARELKILEPFKVIK